MLLSKEKIQKADPPEEDPATSAAVGSVDEFSFIEALRRGEEAAFASLVDRYHSPLLRLAMGFVRTWEVAEEVVQETWLGVLEGLDQFEGRSLLKTWIFRILINQAKSRGTREQRMVPVSSLGRVEEEGEEPAVDPARFQAAGPWVDHWGSPPHEWDEETPERLLLSKEGRAQIDQAIKALPANQRQVIVLRDVEGLSSKEVCTLLEMSEINQRVLLHRARSKVRRALERYLEGEGSLRLPKREGRTG